MNNTKRHAFTACMLGLVIALSGCGTSEPSESEMFAAMIDFDANHQFFGKPEKLKEESKKLGCEKIGEKTFKCLIGSRDGKGMSLPFNFMKSDGKWVMSLTSGGR